MLEGIEMMDLWTDRKEDKGSSTLISPAATITGCGRPTRERPQVMKLGCFN